MSNLKAHCAGAVVWLASHGVCSVAHADDDPAQGSDDPAQASDDPNPPAMTLSGTWLWLDGKVAPGIELGALWNIFHFGLEASFLILTVDSPDFDGSWLGNQLGAHASAAFRSGPLDLSAGLGLDGYLLWAIHSSVVEVALAPRATARYWLLEHLSVALSARVYPLSTSGLSLGTHRNGDTGSPVLISSAVTWRFQ